MRRMACRKNLPTARLTPVTSTAEAVKNCDKQNGVAAIAADLAGQLYQVPIIEKGIQDRLNNMTRFLVVARNSLPMSNQVSYRTSLVVSLSDKVGALQSHFHLFRLGGSTFARLSLAQAEKKSWDYFFFIDFLGHSEDQKVKDALMELKENCSFNKILGSYPENSQIKSFRKNKTERSCSSFACFKTSSSIKDLNS